MTTTTSYGTWNNYNPGAVSPMASVLDAMSGGDIEWIQRMIGAGALDDIVAEYTAAVAAHLPEGVTLGGSDFIGPYRYADEAGEAIRRAIDAADGELSDIIERHDVDNATEETQ